MVVSSTAVFLGMACLWSTYSRLAVGHYENGTSIKEDCALTFFLFPATPIVSFVLGTIGPGVLRTRLPVWLALATLAVTGLAVLSFFGLVSAYLVTLPMNFRS
jgi:hypothetical protein